MKKLVIVISISLLYTLSSSAQNTNGGTPEKTNSGLFKLKPGDHISSDNTSGNKNAPVNTEAGQQKAQDINNVDFQEYLKKVNVEIASNDRSISELKSVLWGKDTKEFKKKIKLVESLEKENEELKTDLNNYISYGLGSWKVFQKEFNHDLLAVASDLSYLGQMYLPGDLISANSK